MAHIVVTSRQSILDVAVQHAGSIEELMSIAAANNKSITDDLVNGEELLVPSINDADIVTQMDVTDTKPATGITQQEINQILDKKEGIDFWGIEYDFIVQ